uniref:Carboxylic ester hydrolase n=1 Tax=Cnaphalocrocis medinalis TaxID=437488 RepID=A0A1U9X1S9_CNAME|nr:carboxylesterase [Cnaphalocrocis medinalis]
MRSLAVACAAALVCSCLTPAQSVIEDRVVHIPQGPIRGYKDYDNNIFEFYGVPYATAPTGHHKFKAPLPAPTWMSTFEAVNKNIACPQAQNQFMPPNMNIVENCLIANIFVPDTSDTALPVVVYVHGGAFQMGLGNFLTAKKLQSYRKFIVVNFNYRLGAHGFLCLGTEDVPGNAGMKDQVALLRWVRENIVHFGGNPNDVTIAGYSAGSASVDLLMLSPSAKGLFNKVIPESGANLAAFSVQIEPVKNAGEYARQLGFKNNFNDIYALEEFYKTVSFETLFTDGFMDRKDSTFLFSPCVERKTAEDSFLEDSPYNILRSGNYEKVPLLYGFASMEGLFRVPLFDKWKHDMNDKFSDFLPPDLQFENEEEKERVANDIKQFYFGNKLITENDILAYIDYFTDVLFAYSTLKGVELHVKAGNNHVFLYEFSYVDENYPMSLVPHTDNVRGANHCAQTMAVMDGLEMMFGSEDNITEEYKGVKAMMRELWSNFITTGSPVPSGSSFTAWPPVGAGGAPHMSIGRTLELRGALLDRRVRFWDAIYERHYRAPQPPPTPIALRTEL